MLLTFYLLFTGLHVSQGCNLVNREQVLDNTAHRGGSVLLPCYCPDLQTTPEEFSWKKDNTKTDRREEISSGSGQYRDRVQLFNGHSPGNLSLLISHLTEEDGGVYWCAIKGAHLIIRLTLKEGPPETTTSTAVVSVHTGRTTSTPYSSKAPNNTGNSMLFFILFPALLLLLGLGGVIYWRCRGWSRGQTDGKEQVRTNTEQQSQDEVMYATVVHSNTTTTTTTVIDIEEKAEYATIRVK
ncbi:CMRF35-like molecule 6 [Pygocentrus nattereri]|uniref:CMRF35-like molecule 6 n=1 Tax=Pygocentrus nattereri TaxID=42514 RepID=UPI001891CA9A|nr:CMRF35-like molecule 6 [Pygocentrus nattereri]